MSKYNVRALTITPNPGARQAVRYCIRKHRDEPNRYGPVGFHAPQQDPKVVV